MQFVYTFSLNFEIYDSLATELNKLFCIPFIDYLNINQEFIIWGVKEWLIDQVVCREFGSLDVKTTFFSHIHFSSSCNLLTNNLYSIKGCEGTEKNVFIGLSQLCLFIRRQFIWYFSYCSIFHIC